MTLDEMDAAVKAAQFRYQDAVVDAQNQRAVAYNDVIAAACDAYGHILGRTVMLGGHITKRRAWKVQEFTVEAYSRELSVRLVPLREDGQPSSRMNPAVQPVRYVLKELGESDA